MNGTYRLRRFRRRWNRPVDVSIPYEYIYMGGLRDMIQLTKGTRAFLACIFVDKRELEMDGKCDDRFFFCLPRHGELSLRFLHLHGRL